VYRRGNGEPRRLQVEEFPMKSYIFAVLAVAGLSAFPLAAQPPAPAGGPPHIPSTRAEMDQAIQQRFAARDANHDGFLTADELGERAPRALERLDADHDGKISAAESRNGQLALFDLADSNHDGTLSDAERQAAMAAMMSGASPPPPPPPAPAPTPQGNSARERAQPRGD
jgi:hypothetical protein